MSLRLTSGQNTIDPLTGIPVTLGQVRITQDGRLRSTQATGEPPYGRNEAPGTDLNFPGVTVDYDQVRVTQADAIRITQDGRVRITQDAMPHFTGIGLPYGYTEVPLTGPLK